MRLVDADWIHQNSDERFPGKKPYQEAWGLTMVDSAPTIDAVPVVRCRECKSYDHGCCVVKRYRGDDSIITMPPDGYCSYGQRKEDDHD